MKYLKLLSLMFFLLPKINAQITGEVLNLHSKEKIAYVNIWVQNQNFGTTTDENGIFKLRALADSSKLVFSAIGYESKTFGVKDLQKQIFLKPISFELATVTVNPPKFKNKIRTGKIDKKVTGLNFISFEQPWRVGKIFSYNSAYDNKPFLKEIEVFTSAHADRTMQIHVLEVSENAVEDWEILESNILIKVEKGQNITKIDLKPYQIKIPKSGVMIVVEWLLIHENRFEFEYKNKDGFAQNDGFFYEPSISTILKSTNKNTWVYKNGIWTKDRPRKILLNNPKGEYAELVMELILSD